MITIEKKIMKIFEHQPAQLPIMRPATAMWCGHCSEAKRQASMVSVSMYVKGSKEHVWAAMKQRILIVHLTKKERNSNNQVKMGVTENIQ